MAQARIIEGVWEEVKRHEEELAGRRVRVVVISNDEPIPEAAGDNVIPSAPHSSSFAHLQGYGKFAHVGGGSEAFAREKQAEIARENRPRK